MKLPYGFLCVWTSYLSFQHLLLAPGPPGLSQQNASRQHLVDLICEKWCCLLHFLFVTLFKSNTWILLATEFLLCDLPLISHQFSKWSLKCFSSIREASRDTIGNSVFPGGPVVMTLTSKAASAGSIPGRGASSEVKKSKHKQKPYCNKFNKAFKNGST